MLSKRKVAAAEDKKEAPPAKKTKEKTEETAEHSEEAYCPCGRRIPVAWLQKTVDEIKEQQRIDEGVDYKEFYSRFSLAALDTIDAHFNWLQGSIGRHGINYNSENFRNFVEYMGMLQKVLTLVQQLEVVTERERKIIEQT